MYSFSRINRSIGRWLFLTPVIAACATNPVTGKSEISLVSEQQEIQMGQEGAQQVAQEIGLIKDQALQNYLQSIGSSIASKSERPNLPWTFRAVDDPSPNAFALPGGYVFVTRGLLDLMNNEAELATVHERVAMPVPDGIDWPAAGGLPEVFTTAHDAMAPSKQVKMPSFIARPALRVSPYLAVNRWMASKAAAMCGKQHASEANGMNETTKITLAPMSMGLKSSGSSAVSGAVGSSGSVGFIGVWTGAGLFGPAEKPFSETGHGVVGYGDTDAESGGGLVAVDSLDLSIDDGETGQYRR